VFTALRGFTGVAGYPSTVPGMKGVPYEVSKQEEVEKAVAELAAKKVDIVKIWVDDHLGKEKKISIDVCKSIIANARKYNLNTAAHIFYHDDALKLSEAGLYAFAHSVRDKPVSDALIAAAKKNRTWQIPTFTREISTFVYAKPHEFLKDAFFLKSADPDAVTGVQEAKFMDLQAKDPNVSKYPVFLKTAQDNLKKLADAGVKIGFGTDTGPPGRFSGYFEHWEMELMAEAGLTPSQIIASFSRDAAEYLGASKDLGTLEANKWADLVVLTKNPLDDIKNARTIEQVMISGVPVQ
jgi:imidazolonepropionase-like amidohydrolase